MATGPQARILELIKRFNNGEKVCIDYLANDYLWEGKSNKTIRRDLDVIKEYFPDSFELVQRGGNGEGGCYKAVTKQVFDNFMKPEMLSLLALTFSMASKSDLFESFDISTDDKKLIAKELKQINNIYVFKNKPFETTKSDNEVLKVLETSIKYRRVVKLKYQINDTSTIHIEVKPYNILFINENFYLAAEIENEYLQFTLYRISKIISAERAMDTFYKNHDIESFIKHIQTPFPKYTPNYQEHLVDITVEIDKNKAYFFKAKKHLGSQEIIEEKENGNLVIKFKVTQELEVESLIKNWIPHIKVISPLSLKTKIEDELRSYLK